MGVISFNSHHALCSTGWTNNAGNSPAGMLGFQSLLSTVWQVTCRAALLTSLVSVFSSADLWQLLHLPHRVAVKTDYVNTFEMFRTMEPCLAQNKCSINVTIFVIIIIPLSRRWHWGELNCSCSYTSIRTGTQTHICLAAKPMFLPQSFTSSGFQNHLSYFLHRCVLEAPVKSGYSQDALYFFPFFFFLFIVYLSWNSSFLSYLFNDLSLLKSYPFLWKATFFVIPSLTLFFHLPWKGNCDLSVSE